MTERAGLVATRGSTMEDMTDQELRAEIDRLTRGIQGRFADRDGFAEDDPLDLITRFVERNTIQVGTMRALLQDLHRYLLTTVPYAADQLPDYDTEPYPLLRRLRRVLDGD